jgi:D-3-phosphoglycerate dehydrogenase / 2-oxoglutarate reductase
VRRVLTDPSFERELVQGDLVGLDVVVETSLPPWSGDDVVGLLSFEPVTADDLAALPKVRVVATPSVGFDHVDVEAATARGVWVCNVPDYCIEEMADHSIALLLALARGVVELDRSVREGGWDHRAAGRLGRLADVRLGIVGYGRIGRAVAARALALGMNVVAFDPLLEPDAIASTGVQPASLEELLRSSTAVTLHAPLTPDTEHLLGARELALLPEGAYVLNVARSGLVDSEALLAALAAGRLGGVALDVLEVEPPDAAAPAPQVPRLVVNPHAGWYSEEAEEAAPRRATEAVRDVLEGRVPANPVNEVASSVP